MPNITFYSYLLFSLHQTLHTTNSRLDGNTYSKTTRRCHMNELMTTLSQARSAHLAVVIGACPVLPMPFTQCHCCCKHQRSQQKLFFFSEQLWEPVIVNQFCDIYFLVLAPREIELVAQIAHLYGTARLFCPPLPQCG